MPAEHPVDVAADDDGHGHQRAPAALGQLVAGQAAGRAGGDVGVGDHAAFARGALDAEPVGLGDGQEGEVAAEVGGDAVLGEQRQAIGDELADRQAAAGDGRAKEIDGVAEDPTLSAVRQMA